MIKKRHLKKKYKIILIILSILTVLLLWSRFISTTGLIIKEYKVVNDNLPSSFEGLKIIHFSDLHYGRTIDYNKLTSLVDEINVLKPDLIFFTGDLIDKDIQMTTEIKRDVTSILSQLIASIGKYNISGNHDLAFKEYNGIMENSGFINLDNTYDIIYSRHYDSIYIAGLESEIMGNPDIHSATDYLNIDADTEENNQEKVIPPYKILLLHTPDTFIDITDNHFDLVLAGHSHNGQIRLPFIGSIVTPEGAKKYYEPHYKINKTELYISGGLGTSNINFRFFNKPSFNFYRLYKK